jgi:16S rRNA (guanine(527)-N(7))-methyltransferase RsmG
MLFLDQDHKKLFDAVCSTYHLSEKQANQMFTYIEMLLTYNEKFNLTAVTDVKDVLAYHIEDALAVTKQCAIAKARALADVGSGGGVPGIPLAIMYPETPMYLIEVQQKKINFLELVMKELGLTQGSVYPYDWRSFLRETSYPVDIVCARASLQPEELVRMFKPSSPYQEAMLIYWAAAGWRSHEKEAPFMFDQRPYHVGQRDRKFVLFSRDGKPHPLAAQ